MLGDDMLGDDMLGDDMLGDDMLGDDMLGDDMLGDDMNGGSEFRTTFEQHGEGSHWRRRVVTFPRVFLALLACCTSGSASALESLDQSDSLSQAAAASVSVEHKSSIPAELHGEPWRQITAQIEVSADARLDAEWQMAEPDRQGSIASADEGATKSGFPERPSDVDAQTWASLQAAVEQAKLLPRPSGIGGQDSQFGFSASVDGNRALVGGPSLAGSGAALVLVDTGSGWVEQAVLLPADGESGDQFGISVSLSGDRALVGAFRDDDNGSNSGSAYVFDFNGTSWTETVKLKPADGAAGDEFGVSASLSGDRALVGARFDDDNGDDSGSAYVFDFDGTSWTETVKLKPADGAAGDEFGVSARLSGDRALVGARRDADNGSNSGSAYVFDFNGTSWTETVKLKPADGAAFDQFGVSVSLSGDRALIGAFRDDDNSSNSGSAYVFDFDGTSWTETVKLKPADGTAGDRFGVSVSLSGDRALVGARFDADHGNDSGSAYVFDFNGTNWTETVKLKPADGAAGDQFGHWVSLSGDRALVGARFDDDNGNDSGSAYVFDFDGTSWTETVKLKPADGAAGDQFGNSVSLSGDRALVGAFGDDDNGSNSGSAYVFDFDGTSWTETAKLKPADGAAGDLFGFSVSLSGDRALVGAFGDDDNGDDSGSAYVFDFNGTSWTETVKLKPADGAADDKFGFSVSLSGDRALVGAHRDDDNGNDSGSAYVFDFDGTSWTETVKLKPADGAAGDQFGRSVSLSGDRALVGAWLDADNGSNSGSAYVFDFDGTSWTETVKLKPADGTAGDRFGHSVSLSGDRALVGARHDADNGNDSGSAYVFDFDGTSWTETVKLKPADGATGDQFGHSVSLSGDRALVGARFDADNGINSGSAYVFDFDGTSWTETVKLKPADGAADDRFGRSVSLSGDRVLVGALGDADNGSNSGSAYVFVDNQPPVAVNDAFTIDEDMQLSGNVFSDNGSGPDTDPDDPLAVMNVGALTASGLGGSVSLQANGDFTYTPPADANGTDSFDYTLEDDNGAMSTATVTIVVNPVDDPPLAVNDTATLDEDDPATAIDVLANDTDIDGGPIAIDTVTQPANGTVLIASGGSSLTYTPDEDYCNDGASTDDFSYTLTPGGSSALVAVTVTCVNDAPAADAGSAATDEDTPVTITLTGSDVDGDALTFAIATPPSEGSLGTITQLTPTSAEVTYTPTADFNGTDSFTFTVNDGNETSTVASVAIAVEPVNDAPAFTSGGDVISVEDTPFSSPWATATSPGPADEAGQTLTFLVNTLTNPGLFQSGPAVDASGTLTFTPTDDTTGAAEVEVVVMDDGGTSNGGDDTSDAVTFNIEVAKAADLSIDKTSGSFFTPPGGTLNYELVVTNPGPSDVIDARIEDPEPARLTFVSWQCIPAGAAQCNTAAGGGPVDLLVTIPEGDSVLVTVNAQLNDTDTIPITNTATVTAPADVTELAPADNSDSDTDAVGLFVDSFESVEPD